jgi:hypothetical protein
MKPRIATIATAAAAAALVANVVYGVVTGPDKRTVPDYGTAAAIHAANAPGGLPPQLAARITTDK